MCRAFFYGSRLECGHTVSALVAFVYRPGNGHSLPTLPSVSKKRGHIFFGSRCEDRLVGQGGWVRAVVEGLCAGWAALRLISR